MTDYTKHRQLSHVLAKMLVYTLAREIYRKSTYRCSVTFLWKISSTFCDSKMCVCQHCDAKTAHFIVLFP